MAIPVYLVGRDGIGVKVNKSGELVTAPGEFDETIFNELGTADVAVNFYGPKPGKQFVITGFLAFGDKDINDASDSTVVIYEATAPDTATVARVLFQFEIGKLQAVPFPNIRVLVNKGVYINAKTSDDDVHLTIVGHFINIIREKI